MKAVLEPIPHCLNRETQGLLELAAENIYLPDRVHLNDIGNFKLFRNIRGAVTKAVGLVGF